MSDKKEKEKQNQSMNYNDRMDGYGFGESESRDSKEEYIHDPYFEKPRKMCMGDGYRSTIGEPYTTDEYGLRNLYGPVDQYVFRSHHLVMRTNGEKPEKGKTKE